MVEQARRGRGQTRQQDQVSSGGDRGEHRARGGGQEGSDDASEEWSGESTGELEGSATEEEATNSGGRSGEGTRGQQQNWTRMEASRVSCMGMRGPEKATPGTPPPTAANKEGARGRHGARPAQRGGQGGRREKSAGKPPECGATVGAARPLEWPTIPPEWGRRRGAARPPKWQKTHGGPDREWAGESSCHRASTPPE